MSLLIFKRFLETAIDKNKGEFMYKKHASTLLFLFVAFLTACATYITGGYDVFPIETPLIETSTQEYSANNTSNTNTIPTPQPIIPPLPTPTPEPEIIEPEALSFVDYWLEQLTLEEKIGQLFMLRLPWQTTAVNSNIRNTMEQIPVGGIILFGDNVNSVQQVQTLTADLQNLARLPLFISTDEEGGRVSRVGRLFEGGATPPAFEIGREGNPQLAYEMGQLNAERLLSLGINMNFAPVADIWSNPANTVIGNRAFGHTPEEVSLGVVATIDGLQDSGVFAVLKHFPGHGDTYEDSHFQLAFHNHGLDRFNEMESIPFIYGINAGVTGVMMAHISTPEISQNPPVLDFLAPWVENGNLPATFSDFWIQDILRGKMGFDGLIITDALDMRALTNYFTDGQIALAAFLAGVDILLMPVNATNAFEALLEGYHTGLFDMTRLDESVRRILTAKEGLL